MGRQACSGHWEGTKVGLGREAAVWPLHVLSRSEPQEVPRAWAFAQTLQLPGGGHLGGGTLGEAQGSICAGIGASGLGLWRSCVSGPCVNVGE